GRRTREIALPGFELSSSCRGWVRQRPRVFLTALPQPQMRCKPCKPLLRPPRLLNPGHLSSKRFALWVVNRPDGLRNLMSFAAGICRIWTAFMKMLSCARPITLIKLTTPTGGVAFDCFSWCRDGVGAPACQLLASLDADSGG